MGSRVRVSSIEDGKLAGTFYPLNRLRFDADKYGRTAYGELRRI